MKVSIITATFNSAATIRDTLNSINNQSYKNIEHLIIDGQSKDDTLEIVKEFQHVSKILSEPDKGIYDAMNKGIKMATGEIIAILNSDDFYAHENVIQDIVNIFQSENMQSLYGDLVYVDAKNTKKVVRNWKAGAFKKNKFIYGWMPPHPTFFVRRELYEKYGYFNTFLKTAADYELMLRFLYKENVSTYYHPEVITIMRAGGFSNQSIKHRLFANQEDKKAWIENNLDYRFYTRILKPLRKLSQFYC